MAGRRLLAVLAILALGAGAAAAAPDPDTLPDPSSTPKAPPGVERSAEAGFRSDNFVLDLAKAGEDGAELDYAVRMKAGDTLVYSWTVEGAPPTGEFYAEFQGNTGESPPTQVLSYREGMGSQAKGSLTAPFDGVHGWLFKNDSAKPVKVRLTIAGFYELRPLRETMGLSGPQYLPFGPPNWIDRYGPVQNPPQN